LDSETRAKMPPETDIKRNLRNQRSKNNLKTLGHLGDCTIEGKTKNNLLLFIFLLINIIILLFNYMHGWNVILFHMTYYNIIYL